jgi:hypothetical protein
LTKEQIVSAILAVAGEPVSGIIKELAPAFADAILAIDAPKVGKRAIEDVEKR